MRKAWATLLAATLVFMPAMPHAQAAIKTASIARAGDDCIRAGKIDAGRGLDSADLECILVTSGSLSGKLVWWYPGLKALGRYEIVTPTDTRTSDSKEVAASRSGDKIGSALGNAMKSEGLLSDYVPRSIIGNSGILALSTFQSYKKRVDSSFIGNLGLLNATYVTKSTTLLTNSMPLARLAQEYEAIAVPINSKYMNVISLLEDMKSNPKALTFIGGAVGGVDHLFLAKLAQQAGVDLKLLQYQSYSSAFSINNALLTSSAFVGLSASADFISGLSSAKLRVLGIASPDRLPWLKGKTLASQGVQLIFGNWYGFFVLSDIPDKDKNNIIHLLDVLHSSITWKNTLLANHWSDGYLAHGDFAALIEAQNTEAKALVNLLGM